MSDSGRRDDPNHSRAQHQARASAGVVVVGEGWRPRWSRRVVPSYSVRNDAALLQQRHHLVGEGVEAARGDVRDEDEAVAGVGLHELVDGARRPSPGVPTKVCRPVTSMISSRMRQVLRLGRAPATRRAVASGSRYMPHAGPALGRSVFSPTVRVERRAAGRPGRTSDRSRFQSCSRNLIAVCAADLLAADLVRRVSAASASVSPRTNVAAGRIMQVVVAAAVLGQPALDVGVERLARLQRAVPGEDRVGARRRRTRGPPRSRRPGRSPGGPAGCAGTLNRPSMSKCWSRWREARRRRASRRNAPVALSASDLVAVPGVEQLVRGRAGTPARAA